jgi:hypothetical protein
MKLTNATTAVKRLSAAIVLALSVAVVLLGVISEVAILAIVAAPFVGVALAVNFMEQTKGNK